MEKADTSETVPTVPAVPSVDNIVTFDPTSAAYLQAVGLNATEIRCIGCGCGRTVLRMLGPSAAIGKKSFDNMRNDILHRI